MCWAYIAEERKKNNNKKRSLHLLAGIEKISDSATTSLGNISHWSVFKGFREFYVETHAFSSLRVLETGLDVFYILENCSSD